MTKLLKFCQLAEFLRARKDLGYTIKELSDATQSTDDAVSRWLNTMEKVGWVKRDGHAEVNGGGRIPILWRWCLKD
jgi:DNA-binding IclR family transcriptional regulator